MITDLISVTVPAAADESYIQGPGWPELIHLCILLDGSSMSPEADGLFMPPCSQEDPAYKLGLSPAYPIWYLI